MNNSLLELLQVGGQKNYEFHFKIIEEKLNTITLDNENKIINVRIGLPEDESLPNLIENVISELQ